MYKRDVKSMIHHQPMIVASCWFTILNQISAAIIPVKGDSKATIGSVVHVTTTPWRFLDTLFTGEGVEIPTFLVENHLLKVSQSSRQPNATRLY